MAAVLLALLGTSSARAADKDYFKNEYGSMSNASPVRLTYGGQTLTFSAKVAATQSRILIAASDDMAARASSGIMRNLAAGLIGRRLDPEPFRLAALQHLAQIGRKKCKIERGGQVTDTQYEWNFDCLRVPLQGFRR